MKKFWLINSIELSPR